MLSGSSQPHPCENPHHDGLSPEISLQEGLTVYTARLFCTMQARAVEILFPAVAHKASFPPMPINPSLSELILNDSWNHVI